jgi:hypothetical protein
MSFAQYKIFSVPETNTRFPRQSYTSNLKNEKTDSNYNYFENSYPNAFATRKSIGIVRVAGTLNSQELVGVRCQRQQMTLAKAKPR